jgi:hypothetical protein
MHFWPEADPAPIGLKLNFLGGMECGMPFPSPRPTERCGASFFREEKNVWIMKSLI